MNALQHCDAVMAPVDQTGPNQADSVTADADTVVKTTALLKEWDVDAAEQHLDVMVMDTPGTSKADQPTATIDHPSATLLRGYQQKQATGQV